MGLCVGGSEATGVYVGDVPASAVWLGDEMVWSAERPVHDSLASYSLAELKAVSADLEANGTGSASYEKFHGFLASGAEWVSPKLSGYGSYPSADQELHCRVVGILHDDKADGTGKAGLTLMAAHSLPLAYQQNSSDSNSGGWSSSKMRTKLNSGAIWQNLPADLQSAIVSVKKRTNNTGKISSTSAVTETTDKVWLASAAEMWGDMSLNSTFRSNSSILNLEGTGTTVAERQYEYFSANGVKSNGGYSGLASLGKTNSGADYAQNEGTLNVGRAWLRSPSSAYNLSYMSIHTDGSPNTGYASSGRGVVLGFCI